MSVLRNVSNGPLSLKLLFEGCLRCRVSFHGLYLHRYSVSLSRTLYYIFVGISYLFSFQLENRCGLCCRPVLSPICVLVDDSIAVFIDIPGVEHHF